MSSVRALTTESGEVPLEQADIDAFATTRAA